ncbi:uncharacterized protein LODBEIA_P28880 [Lodderomyces beijingensis]|uniref:FAS1 domain-containing protein n=1 Tax=Lodderomyces beijingensis TaxID=1775926 RepID=A0ABP0ZKI4_9ASCO
MKVPALISLVLLTNMVAAKNVFNLHQLQDLTKEENNEEAVADKRDAKNTFDLAALKESLQEKRDAKNVVDLSRLSDEGKAKRKNTPNLEALAQRISKVTVQKRKNVVNLNDFVKSHDFTADKRDAKNTFDVTSYFQNHPLDAKRDQQVLENDKTKQEENLYFIFNQVDCFNNLLQSILPQLKSISIFAGYIRSSQEFNTKTESVDQNMLILAPSDDAIEDKLSNLKPWEFPHSLDGIQDEKQQDEIIESNLENFLQGHIVTNFENKVDIVQDQDDKSGKVVVTVLDNGKVLQIKQDQLTEKFSIRLDGKTNAWIPVESVRQVENGFIFVINDSLVKP